MERPAKRMRMWKPETSESSTTFKIKQSTPSPQPHDQQRELVLPTRTIDLSDFKRRAFHAYRSGEGYVSIKKRNAGIYLMPRAPVATVTAKIIAVAVDDGVASSLVTTVSEPTSDLVLSIGTMGSLTIPGVGAITSAVESVVSEITGTPALGPAGSGNVNSPSSAPGNGTSVASGDNTATVTTTSTLSVSYLNGTLIPPRTTSSRSASASSQRILSQATSSEEDVTSTLSSDTDSGNVIATSTTNGDNAVIQTSTISTPSPTASESSGGGITLSPQQQQVVGGVVGGVAGVALVLVALLYFLKWYRQRLKKLGQLPEQLAANREITQQKGNGNTNHEDQSLARPQTAETQRSSIAPIAAIATRLKQLRPYSTNTVSTASTRESVPPGGSEKAFQRIAGRKIPSVLSTGGDGYGGNYGIFGNPIHQRHESEISIYQDEFVNAGPSTRNRHDTFSEPSTPTQSNPFADPPSIERVQQNAHRSFSPTPNFSRPSFTRDYGSPIPRSQSSNEHRTQFSPVMSPVDGYATLRPSPARTPVTQSPTISAVRLPQPSSTPPLMAGNVPDLPTVPALNLPPKRKTDRVGRSFTTEGASASRISTRTASGVSGRTSSTGGRFREDLD